jgi:hypothetical protein
LIASATGRSYAAGPHSNRGESEWRRFEDARRNAGVKAQRIHHPVDDDRYIYVELDFDSTEQAEGFKAFLETKVWSSPDASPGLGGTPRARVLTAVRSG